VRQKLRKNGEIGKVGIAFIRGRNAGVLSQAHVTVAAPQESCGSVVIQRGWRGVGTKLTAAGGAASIRDCVR